MSTSVEAVARPLGAGRRAERVIGVLGHPAVLQCTGLAAALACWAVALPLTDPTGVSGYGLLAALPPAYYVGLVALTCGFALCATRRVVLPSVLAAHVFALVAMLHATTAILYPEPRFTWTYKHVGVIDYVMAHGSVDRSIDIYQNWPGFFALNAWLSRTAGIAPLDYAGWAEVFFAAAAVAAVVFAVRGVTRDPSLVWGAAWLFVVANWIGQDYLAPQAFGFFLSVVVLGIVIRCAPVARPPRRRIGWALVRAANRAAAVLLRGQVPRMRRAAAAPLTPRAALAVGAICTLAVVISHQISPVMLILSISALVAAAWRPPLWVLAAIVAAEAWWVLLGYDFVAEHFRLFDFDPSASARSISGGLPGVTLGADLSRLAILAMLAVAAAGFVRRVRSGRWDGAAVVLALAPALLILFQSYGGEGALRVYLFALPWLAFFAAVACQPAQKAVGGVRRAWRLVAATLIIGSAALFGYFGQEPTNYVTRDDVAVSRWYLDHTPAGTMPTYVAPNFPDRLDANYAKHLDEPAKLLDQPGFADVLRAASCGTPCEMVLGRDVGGRLGSGGYLIISPSQERYARYYGLARHADFQHLERALALTPGFRVAYRSGAARVYRFAPMPAPPASQGRRPAGA